MPHHKQFINGFDFEDKKTKIKKEKFDKNTVIADNENSCHNCINAKLLDADKKSGLAYHCKIQNYTFMHYWKQTIAKDCDSFKNT